ncbi:MAG: C25 family cysteine peptidase, partial [Candidatus Cloacimonetes bacterium]|nr:C25 family cysteine peptidase [Candidatus Cloacimonadota bacterium]
MKQYIVAILLLAYGLLGAAGLQNYSVNGNVLNARMEALRLSPMAEMTADLDEGDVSAPTPAITTTLAFPFVNAALQVNSMTWNVFDHSGNFLFAEQKREEGVIHILHGFTFREMRGFTIKIETQVSTETQVRTLVNIDFDLIGSQPIAMPTTMSAAFEEAYKTLADNYDQSYLRNLSFKRPSMLIISHTQLAPYQQEYINWKKAQGYDVYVANRSEIGSSIQQIKDYILSHYQQYGTDFLFLWGDVTGTFAIPTNFYPSPEYAENDADDNYFATLDGDDYFPEMVVGRFSFSDASEFITMVNKTISYEKTPYLTDSNWMKKALVVAGNYAEGGLRPTTPVYMSRWLRNKMLNYGYTQVDSVFYPPTYPGTAPILQAINQGVQFISYRGWGDANGWHYPSFHIPDLNSTFNGPKMPIVFSIVCNTGDFANPVNPSFGERWMRMGTMSAPGGCIAFVGPSDLHTKTRLNNSISSGAFRSILDKGVRGFGSSVLVGKMELYKNFPNDLAPGQYVAFYYHVYNILSDPSLNMWVLTPQTISSNVIEGGLNISQSDSHIRINSSALEGAMVTGTKNGTDYSYATVKNGYTILPVDPNQTGNLTVTITKPNFVPLVAELIADSPATIGITSNSLLNSMINPNTNYNLELQLKNFSANAYSNVAVTLGSNHTAVNIAVPTFTIGSLAAGATTTLTFAFTTSGALTPFDIMDFSISITNPVENHAFQLKAGGAKIIVYDHNGTFHSGQTSPITFTVCNTGNVSMENINITINSLTTAAVAQSAPINIGTLLPGEETQFTASITLLADVTPGHNLPFKFTASNASDYSYFCFYSGTAGTPGTNDPTGPCEYGYYAYDSTDTGYNEAPVYNWVELDPEGGTPLGNVFLNKDDGTKTVDL